MKHEGPSVEEALPPGEDALELDELDRVTEAVFGLNELASESLGEDEITEADVSLERWEILCRAQAAALNEMTDSLKRMVIDGRKYQ